MSSQLANIPTSALAAELGVDVSTVRRWVHAGKIKPSITTAGGHHRFVADDVRAQLQALADGGDTQ